MRIQLWSYNYDPEPTGIAPLSRTWAHAMAERGHEIEVVAAHPHYPTPVWGRRLRPYCEIRDGIRVLRLPLWVGRASALERIRQEATFAASMTLAAPFLGTPDVIVAVSPCFPALIPAMIAARARRIPWVLWLQDILPDGATETGILEEGRITALSRRLERAAYRDAAKIIVISDSFAENLRSKGVPDDKLARVYNPASRPILGAPRHVANVEPTTVLTMGNIGHTQNLVAVTTSFQDSRALAELDAHFVMAGDGAAGPDVRAAIHTDRVQVTGVLDGEALEKELRRAAVAVVSQGYEGIDFNVPSKLMNFMGYGIPTVASVRPDSEVASIIRASGGGWVTDGSDTGLLANRLADALREPDQLAERGHAALDFARSNFSPAHVAHGFDGALADVVGGAKRRERSREPAQTR